MSRGKNHAVHSTNREALHTNAEGEQALTAMAAVAAVQRSSVCLLTLLPETAQLLRAFFLLAFVFFFISVVRLLGHNSTGASDLSTILDERFCAALHEKTWFGFMRTSAYTLAPDETFDRFTDGWSAFNEVAHCDVLLIKRWPCSGCCPC